MKYQFPSVVNSFNIHVCVSINFRYTIDTFERLDAEVTAYVLIVIAAFRDSNLV